MRVVVMYLCSHGRRVRESFHVKTRWTGNKKAP